MVESQTRLYNIWRKMKHRCFSPGCDAYERYGGIGITVCQEWSSFKNFRKWALENGYKDDLSIDRIDNNGNYCPENCRWATAKQQMNNKSDNRLITHHGKTQTLAQWAEELGINRYTLFNRIDRGMSIEEALSKPVERKKHGEATGQHKRTSADALLRTAYGREDREGSRCQGSDRKSSPVEGSEHRGILAREKRNTLKITRYMSSGSYCRAVGFNRNKMTRLLKSEHGYKFSFRTGNKKNSTYIITVPVFERMLLEGEFREVLES